MNRGLICLTAAVCLVVTAVKAGESDFSMPPTRYHWARVPVPLGVSRQQAALHNSLATPDDAASNDHIALWQSFDVPGFNGTQPSAINDLGEITGSYFDANGNVHGFVRAVGGKIVTFDAPNVGYPFASVGTTPTGINDKGDIVGYYPDASGGWHGFIRSAEGTFTIIDDPNSNSSPPASFVNAINNSGVVVGQWNDANGNYHGFVRQPDGSFTTVDAPGDLSTTLYNINDLGQVGGQWIDAATLNFHGLLRYPSGRLVTYDAPNVAPAQYAGTFQASAQALNPEGSVTGYYADANGGNHGYVRYADGKFAEFTVPGGGASGGAGTYTYSLNVLGTVVGGSLEPNGATIDGYVRFADGTIVIANAPVSGQQATLAYAINDLNELTGPWVDAEGNEHGFVAVAVP